MNFQPSMIYIEARRTGMFESLNFIWCIQSSTMFPDYPKSPAHMVAFNPCFKSALKAMLKLLEDLESNQLLEKIDSLSRIPRQLPTLSVSIIRFHPHGNTRTVIKHMSLKNESNTSLLVASSASLATHPAYYFRTSHLQTVNTVSLPFPSSDTPKASAVDEYFQHVMVERSLMNNASSEPSRNISRNEAEWCC